MPKVDTDLLGKQTGIVRTDMYCHSCSKNFIARLNYDINGNHAIECPFCGHLHYRQITDGKVTGQRYDSDNVACRTATERAGRGGQWKHDSLAMESSSTSVFLRNRWLNPGTGDEWE